MLKNIPVLQKLILAFAAMILVCGAATSVVLLDLRKIQVATQSNQASEAVVQAADGLISQAVEQLSVLRGYVSSGSAEFPDRFTAYDKAFDQAADRLLAADADQAYAETVQQIRQTHAQFDDESQALMALARDPATRAEAQAQVPKTARLTALRAQAGKIVQGESAKLAGRRAAQAAAFHQAYIGMAAGAGVALVSAVGLAAILAQLLGAAVVRMTAVMGRLASGDNEVVVPDTGRRDEIGHMARAVLSFKDAAVQKREVERQMDADRERAKEARVAGETERARIQAEQKAVVDALGQGLTKLEAGVLTFRLTHDFPADYRKLQTDFNSAMDKLAAAMDEIVEGAGGIRAGAGQISDAADNLAQRTERQAASLEQTAAALEQITVTVRRSAGGAAEAQRTVGQAKAAAETSGRVVGDAVAAMTAIETSSREISQIIGVIDEIAFQTNLLALNAGVEAARAGDAGRGFAVVASEVRALAQRSADAAKQIKALIQTSGQHVGQGVALVGETGQVLQRIVSGVSDLNTVITAIAASAQEQAVGLQQVNQAVVEMDQVTQQNAAMVEQSTAASREMHSQAVRLSTLVGRFDTGLRQAPQPVRSGPRIAASGGVRQMQQALAQGWTEF